MTDTRTQSDEDAIRRFTFQPARIMERLKAARADGYVISVGDFFPSDISVGAPVLARSGRLLGAISLSVSIDRFTAREAQSRFARLVSTAAKSVTA